MLEIVGVFIFGVATLVLIALIERMDDDNE